MSNNPPDLPDEELPEQPVTAIMPVQPETAVPPAAPPPALPAPAQPAGAQPWGPPSTSAAGSQPWPPAQSAPGAQGWGQPAPSAPSAPGVNSYGQPYGQRQPIWPASQPGAAQPQPPQAPFGQSIPQAPFGQPGYPQAGPYYGIPTVRTPEAELKGAKTLLIVAIGIAALGFFTSLIATATAQWGVAPTAVVVFVGLLHLGALACAGVSAWKLFGVVEGLLQRK